MQYTPLRATPAGWYEAVGLKSGLEIHQQLLTRKKLFCRCPAGIYSDRWDAEILRHMRPTLSELGEYDGTALMEFKTKKQIIYRINNQTVCTYEFDDTPPFMVNEEAMGIALEVTLMLGCSLVSEIHITRKQYLDGSIPTGFQRTTILGVDGAIPYGDRTIRIRQLGMEEDACREVSDRGHERVYITDRLGMPLIETVTEAEMHTPQDVAAVAEILRQLVRATGKVRTGPGAARQDVNVSVAGGRRCEIKGVCSIKRIPELVHNEAFRQALLLATRDELGRRGITPESFSFGHADLTGELAMPEIVAVKEALAAGGRLAGVLLRGFEGILRRFLNPGRIVLDEIADRVRVIACLDAVPNLLATDSSQETFYPGMWRHARQRLHAGDHDALILVWGPGEDVATAVQEIAARARELCEGIPNETRQPMPDGTTRFERILPGPDRMYPDTDLPPKPIADAQIEAVRAVLPETPWSRAARYAADGLHPELARLLSISRFADLYDEVRRSCPGLPATLPAATLAAHLRGLQRRGVGVEKLDAKFVIGLFDRVARGGLCRDALLPALDCGLAHDRQDIGFVVADAGLSPAAPEEVEDLLADALEEARSQAFAGGEARLRFAMGLVMGELRGRVDGRALAERLRKELAVPGPSRAG